MIISISGLTDVYKFISEASKVEGDILIKRGKFIVDAKSVMGVFSIDMSENVTVTYPEDAVNFEQFIAQFEAKAE